MESGIGMSERSSWSGFTIIELIFAMGILSVAVLGMAGVMAGGLRQLNSSPSSVIAAQKAAQAVEAVFAARDSHTVVWDKVRNVHGASGSDGGVFLDGAQPLRLAGADGLVNTGDDSSTVESTALPGPDNLLGTADDRRLTLDRFTRTIDIRDVPNENGQLRSVTVTITYPSGTGSETYTLTTYVSSFS